MTRTKRRNPSRKLGPEQTAPRVPRNILLGIAVIVVGTFLIYIPAIRAGFIWDDPEHVINNHTLRDGGGFVEMWTQPRSLPQWYPLVHTTFWIEYQLWGLRPMGYHVDNVILHIGSALLIWRLLMMLEVPGAWLAAAIFAMHPVHVESVAWVTERKNVLSGFFYFSSLIAYLKWDRARYARSAPVRHDHYFVALGLFLAALLSKTVVATLPATILVILWWRRGRIRWTDVTPLIPFFIIGIGAGSLTAYLEVHSVGARSDKIIELNLSHLDRVLVAGRAVWFYARKLIVPWPLVFIYPQWKQISPALWWQWLFPIGLVAVIVTLLLQTKRVGRAPAAAVMIFCGTLFPALGFLNVYPMRFSYVADHFQYHASAALIALFGAMLCRYAGKYGRLVLVPLAALTLLRTPVYRNVETLWRRTLAQNPDSWMVQTNLGKVLVLRAQTTGDQGAFEEATRLYERALQLDPRIHDTHVNIATMLARQGQDERAMDEFEQALRINPHFAPAYSGLAQIYQRRGDIDRAIEYFNKALEYAPNYAIAHFNLARLLEGQGRLPEAISHLREAVAGIPEDPDARYELGTLLLRTGQYPEAVYNLNEAVRIRPKWAEAWTNLGAAQLRARHPADAMESFRTALSMNPDLKQAQQGLEQAQRAR